MRRVSKQEWENEHMHNPMTEGEALAVSGRDAAFYLQWALDVLSEHGLDEFSILMQQMHREAEQYLAALTAAQQPVQAQDMEQVRRVAADYAREIERDEQPVQEGGGECPKCRGTGEVCTGYIDGTPEMFDCTCPAAAPPSAPVASNPALCPACKTWPVDGNKCPRCGNPKPFAQQPAQAAPLPASEFVGATARVRDCNCQRYDGRDCRKCFSPPYPDEATPPGDDAAGGGHG